MPLYLLQEEVPHLQSIELEIVPSRVVQVSPLVQVLVEDLQNRPEVVVHGVVPHKQGAVFGRRPSD